MSEQPAWVGRLQRILFAIVIPIAFVGIGVLSLLLASRPAPPARAANPDMAVLVETEQARAFGGQATQNADSFFLEADGQAVSARQIVISALVPGEIQEKSPACNEGEQVQPETLLLKIDPFDYEFARQQAESESKQADEQWREAVADRDRVISLLELAEQEANIQEKELIRITRLHRTGVATDQQLEAAQRANLVARTSVQRLKSEQAVLASKVERFKEMERFAEVKMQKADRDKERTVYRSPVKGVVLQDLVEVGTYVQPGQELVRIEDTSRIEVSVNLQMDQLEWIRRTRVSAANPYDFGSLAVTVVWESPTGGRYAWDGVLSRFEGLGLNERTRTIPSRVVVSEPNKGRRLGSSDASAPAPPLLRGMFVTVRIPIRPRETLIAVPTRAVRPRVDDEPIAGLEEGAEPLARNVVWLFAPKPPSADANGAESPSATEAKSAEREEMPPPALVADQVDGETEATTEPSFVPGEVRIAPVHVLRYLPGFALVQPATDRLIPGSRVITSPIPGLVTEGRSVRAPAPGKSQTAQSAREPKAL